MDDHPAPENPRKGPGKTLLMIWGTAVGFVLLIVVIGWLTVANR